MSQFLIFRLHGAFSAFGAVTVGKVRNVSHFPTRSGILGFVCSALGVGRDDEELQLKVHQGYGMALRVDREGEVLSDFHIVQVPDPKQEYFVAADAMGKKHNNIITQREYRQGAIYTVALWARSEAPYTLEELKKSLNEPKWNLFLGRKNCPVAVPLEPQLIEGANLKEGFAKSSFKSDELDLKYLLKDLANPKVFWDSDAISGMPLQQTLSVRDQLISRSRWQFGNRPVQVGTYNHPQN